MDGHRFISALLYALIGFDTFVSKPMTLYALSLPSSSSLTSSQPDSISPPILSIVDDKQSNERIPINGSKSRSNSNNVGSSTNSNSIVTKTKQTCKLSEMKCPNGICIPLSKFCNGVPDCSDKSDEPADCNGELNKIVFYRFQQS